MQGVGVKIDSQQPRRWLDSRQDHRRVTALADGAVHVRAVRADGEGRNKFIDQGPECERQSSGATLRRAQGRPSTRHPRESHLITCRSGHTGIPPGFVMLRCNRSWARRKTIPRPSKKSLSKAIHSDKHFSNEFKTLLKHQPVDQMSESRDGTAPPARHPHHQRRRVTGRAQRRFRRRNLGDNGRSGLLVETYRDIVPDEPDLISDRLTAWCDGERVDVVLTTGGTGLGPRDVTPEATRSVIDYEVPGIPEAIRVRTADRTRMAVLSRAVAGMRRGCLVINLPGSPRGVREALEVVGPIIGHAVDIARGEQRAPPPLISQHTCGSTFSPCSRRCLAGRCRKGSWQGPFQAA